MPRYFVALAAFALIAADRPNVVVILSDDQGYGDFSAHGNPVLKTPHLDRMRSQSVRLSDFHVAPMCTPTRGQLLTGVDAVRNGATSVCAGRSFIRRGIPTLAELFTAGGYKTALFGKWHLGDSYPNLPHHKGFQESVYHLGWGVTAMAETWCNDNFNGRYFRNGRLKQYPGYCTDTFFELTKTYIRERRAKNEPYFVYLPTNAPHGPHWVSESYKKPYDKRGPAAFFGMIANIDDNVGKLLDFLGDDNTIVVYFHDNGGTAGVKLFNAGMRGGKTTYYEGGHRAACFIRWPGLLKPRDIDELTQVQDLAPTLLEMCGVSPGAAQFDGTSLAGLLRDDRPLSDRTLVVQYGQHPKEWDCCVMWKRWRLVHGKDLYDLSADPGQQTNVADKHSDVMQKLRDHYAKWWADVRDRIDDMEPVVIGSPVQNPVTLTAADWANVYCDNMNNLRDGKPANSYWTVLPDRPGVYRFDLRRWPKEADAAIAAGVPAFRAVDGGLPEGKALPIVKVRLKVGDSFDETRPVAVGDKAVTFNVPMKAGEKVRVQSWCLNAAGNELCGAYFADVTRGES